MRGGVVSACSSQLSASTLNESNLTFVAGPLPSCLTNRPILVTPFGAVRGGRDRRRLRRERHTVVRVLGDHVRAVVARADPQVVRRRRQRPAVGEAAAVAAVEVVVGGQRPLDPLAGLVARGVGIDVVLELQRRLGEVVRVLPAVEHQAGRLAVDRDRRVVELRRHRPRALGHLLHEDVVGREVAAEDVALGGGQRQVAAADRQLGRRRVDDLPLLVERRARRTRRCAGTARSPPQSSPGVCGSALPATTLKASTCTSSSPEPSCLPNRPILNPPGWLRYCGDRDRRPERGERRPVRGRPGRDLLRGGVMDEPHPDVVAREVQRARSSATGPWRAGS